MYYIIFTYIGSARCETFEDLEKTLEVLSAANFSIQGIVVVEEES